MNNKFATVAPNSPAVFLGLESIRSDPGSPSFGRSAPRTPTVGSSTPSTPSRNKQGCYTPYSCSVLPQHATPISPTLLPPAVASAYAHAAAADAPSVYPPAYDATATNTHNPYSPQAAPSAHRTSLQGNVAVSHVSLQGKVPYVRIPCGLTETHVEDLCALAHSVSHSTTHSLFFGQMRFETTAGELHWLLRQLVGVSAIKIESRGKGCFAAVFRDERDAEAVRSLHKSLLCDYTGVWYARTPEEKDVLLACAREHVQVHSARHRLPKDCVVVEAQRTKPSYLQHSACLPAASGSVSPHHSYHTPSYAAPSYHSPSRDSAPGSYGSNSLLVASSASQTVAAPPSYVDTMHHSTSVDVSAPGGTATPSLASSAQRSLSTSTPISLEPSPLIRPRHDSAAMSPVTAEPPTYCI